MRAAPDLYSSISAGMQASQADLQKSVDQLSSGKRVSLTVDDPSAYGADLRSLDRSGIVDRYSSSCTSTATLAQVSDSALSSVITSLTQAISLGTQGGNSNLTPANRASLVAQISAVQQEVLSQANTTWQGKAVFAGNANQAGAFVADSTAPTGFRYTGSAQVNEVQIGDGSQVALGLPGEAIFNNTNSGVFSALASLSGAVSSGDSGAVSQAVQSVSSAVAYLGTVRASYAGVQDQVTAGEAALQQETVTLTSQQSSLMDVDVATAATQLTQAQTAHSAILALAAKILPESLLNYLH